jgi:NAD+ synthetase
MIKVAFGNIYSRPLDLEGNYERADEKVRQAKARGADLIVFPQGFLSGTELGMLGKADRLSEDRDWFIRQYNSLTEKLSAENEGIYILTDYAILGEGRTEFFCQLYLDGKDIDWDSELSIKGVSIKILEEKSGLEEAGGLYDCYILMDQSPVIAGERYLLHKAMKELADKSNAAVCANLGGYGYTSHPDVYMPCIAFIDGDIDIFTVNVSDYAAFEGLVEIHNGKRKELEYTAEPDILRFPVEYSPNPMIPANVPEQIYCMDLFTLQTTALAARLQNLGMKDAVLALSGGLDSSMALLVTVNAFDMLGLDRKGIHVVSMPGFGTSNTTRSLAEELTNSLGLEFKLIDITTACRQALLDIGHDGETPDVTFENVQARMRTLNGLNLANMYNGLMVGTGDLSEEAMGFSTYGGDHLASYNINSSVSKTVMRTMLPYVIELDNLTRRKDTIRKILDIPVSPELVPHGGEILQKTEEILAPYKLIDFYIYCLTVAGIAPDEMAYEAGNVFGDEFSKEYLDEKAQMFFRRFISGQFKRSSAPEGAITTHVHLSAAMRSVPSDATPKALVRMAKGELY